MDRMISWGADLATAYVGGLALGAPVGLFGFWLTGSRSALTGVIVAAMLGLFTKRRLSRRARVPIGPERVGLTAS
jgi:hypothetical protein